MIIDFDKIGAKTILNFRGGEKSAIVSAFEDDENKILKITLVPGASIGEHKHETDSEIVYILSGEGKALYFESEEKLSAGLCHYCPNGASHSIINDSDDDLVFFAVIAKR